jgi:hypothetical protein
MDGRHFDALAKRFSSRRSAIGGLLAGLLLPLDASARGKGKDRQKGRGRGKGAGKNRDKGRGKAKKRASAQVEPCWRAGACIPKKGANVSRCDLGAMRPLQASTAPAAISAAPTSVVPISVAPSSPRPT